MEKAEFQKSLKGSDSQRSAGLDQYLVFSHERKDAPDGKENYQCYSQLIRSVLEGIFGRSIF